MKQNVKNCILTIDDDPMISMIIQKYTGIKSIAHSSFSNAAIELGKINPSVVFIDVHLAGGENGIDCIPQLRNQWPYVPLIVMTGDVKGEVIAQALASGANDFIRKPIDKEELIARMQTRLEEMHLKSSGNVSELPGGVKFFYQQKCLQSDMQKIYISPLEAELLQILIGSKGSVISKEALKRRLWGGITVTDNALDRRVSSLRRSLKEVGATSNVSSIYGEGLVLQSVEDIQKLRAAG